MDHIFVEFIQFLLSEFGLVDSETSKNKQRNEQTNRSPDAVEDISILKYPEQLVVCCDFMEVCSLFICKEQVGFPDGVQHGGVQVQRVIWILLICQARVIPLLP